MIELAGIWTAKAAGERFVYDKRSAEALIEGSLDGVDFGFITIVFHEDSMLSSKEFIKRVVAKAAWIFSPAKIRERIRNIQLSGLVDRLSVMSSEY